MLKQRAGEVARPAVVLAVAFALAVIAVGCARRPTVSPSLISPYPADKMWAVAPMINESGTSVVDALHMSDVLAQELQQVYRINVVPVSRVLEAMRALDIGRIQSVHDAQALIRTLDLDGLVVGAVTAYDPYQPPRLGMTLQLYTSGAEGRAEAPSLDTGKGVRLLGASPSDRPTGILREFEQPVASVAAVIDASDNGVLLDVQRFAEGRDDPVSALGWRRFLYSMDAYTQYVGHRMIRDLLREERIRMSRTMESARASTSASSRRSATNIPPPA